MDATCLTGHMPREGRGARLHLYTRRSRPLCGVRRASMKMKNGRECSRGTHVPRGPRRALFIFTLALATAPRFSPGKCEGEQWTRPASRDTCPARAAASTFHLRLSVVRRGIVKMKKWARTLSQDTCPARALASFLHLYSCRSRPLCGVRRASIKMKSRHECSRGTHVLRGPRVHFSSLHSGEV
jgi:hypothetical protein